MDMCNPIHFKETLLMEHFFKCLSLLQHSGQLTISKPNFSLLIEQNLHFIHIIVVHSLKVTLRGSKHFGVVIFPFYIVYNIIVHFFGVVLYT